jgi:hypothetical protein
MSVPMRLILGKMTEPGQLAVMNVPSSLARRQVNAHYVAPFIIPFTAFMAAEMRRVVLAERGDKSISLSV